MIRCAVYARVSSEDSDEVSLPAQVAACRDYATANGWAIVAEFVESDRGISGVLESRPALDAAKDFAGAGGYDVLLARDRGRVARDLLVAKMLQRELRQYGVRLDFVWGGGISEGDEGETLDDVLFALEAAERRRIVRRLTAGRRNAVKKGSVVSGGHAPYGYRRVKLEGRTLALEVDEPKAAIVRLIFRLYTDQGRRQTMRSIARLLADEGIPSPEGRGEWAPSTVRGILQNPAYKGEWVFGRRNTGALAMAGKRHNPPENWLRVAVPAIVDAEAFDEAAARLKTNRQAFGGRRVHQYLVGNRITCGHCGGPAGGRYEGKYYVCAAAYRGPDEDGAGGCGVFRCYPVARVDDLVWGWVVETLHNPLSIVQSQALQAEGLEARQAPAREELATVDKALARERAKLDRLLGLYVDGQWDKGTLDEQARGIRASVAGLARRRDELLAALSERAMTKDEAEALAEWVGSVSLELDSLQGGEDFTLKRAMVEALDVRVKVLAGEGGEKRVEISSVAGYITRELNHV